MNKPTIIFLLGMGPSLLLGTVEISPVVAQDVPSIEELLRIIEQQQAQLQQQQSQIDLQSKELSQLQQLVQKLVTKTNAQEEILESHDKVVEAADKASKEQVEIALDRGQPEPPATTIGLSEESRHPETTAPDLQYSRSAIFLRDPKTGTEVGVHGFAQFQAIYDSVGLDNNEFDTATIPVDGAPPQTKYSVNPSRIGISSHTPLGWGQINTLVALDLNGELNEPDWRLREAYGEFIQDNQDYALLAGQTYSTALDLQSVPETVDFAGPTGYYARRQPLVRFSKLFDHKFRIDVGADTPENTVYLNADTSTRWPDLTLAGTWLTNHDLLSHLRFQGTIRDLQATDMVTGWSGSTTGWHVALSGKVKFPVFDENDNFKFGVLYGDGFGGQLKSGPADAAFNPTTLELEAIGAFATYGGYQHWWMDSLRSNLVYGLVKADNPSFIPDDRLKSTYYLAGNLVWNPWKNVTIGLEYLYGNRENIDGNSGDANRFIFSTKFDY